VDHKRQSPVAQLAGGIWPLGDEVAAPWCEPCRSKKVDQLWPRSAPMRRRRDWRRQFPTPYLGLPGKLGLEPTTTPDPDCTGRALPDGRRQHRISARPPAAGALCRPGEVPAAGKGFLAPKLGCQSPGQHSLMECLVFGGPPRQLGG